MADVFLSYASDDRDRVAPLVNFLEHRGWSVWWDRSLRPGETWPQVIERELNRARCVVVAWSSESVGSPWVRLEANRARERRNLIPVLLDPVAVPPEFAVYQSFDMRDGTPDRALEALGDGVALQLRKRRLRQFGISSAMVALAALVAASLTCAFSEACGRLSMTPSVPAKSFAVVATELRLADPSTTALMEAFVDDIRRSLRRTSIGTISSRAETGAVPPGASPIDVGRRLRVRWLLALSVVGDGDDLRVLAELIDTSTGYLSDDWTVTGTTRNLALLNTTLVRSIVTRFAIDPGAVAAADTEPSDAYNAYIRGRAALRAGSDDSQLAQAETLLNSVLSRWPRYPLAEAALCRLHLLRYERTRAADQFSAGERHCNRALEIDPTSGEAAVALGQLNLTEGRPDQARAMFERAATQSDTMAEARIGLGRVAQAQGRIDDAEREYRLAVDAEPAYWRTYTALGNFLFDTGRGAEALAEHRRAATLAKHDGVALNNIGAALYVSGQLEGAVAAWQGAIDIAPQAATYSNLGAAYYLLGQFDRAAAAYERSIALQSNDFRVWINLGDARAFAGAAAAAQAYASAATLIEQHLKVNANDAGAWAASAAVKAALGDERGARRDLDRALAMQPAGDWQVPYVAAVTEARLGAIEAARRHVEAVLQSGFPKTLVDLDPALRGVIGG